MKKFLAIIALIIVAGCTPTTPNTEEDNNIISIEEVAAAESLMGRAEMDYQPQRTAYGYGTWQGKKFEIKEIFQKLPPLPEDFYKPKFMLMSGKSSGEDMCKLGAEYYSQPEFFRDGFEKVGIRFYKEPDPHHWTPEGYGTYPHEAGSTTLPGEIFEVCTFFHSSWGVETYQGFAINTIFPSSVVLDGQPTEVDAEQSKKYIMVDVEPKNVLVGPAYLIFEPDWVQKIRLNITVREDTPPGTYAIGFDVGKADLQQAKEWYNQYQEKYQPKSGITISEPQFKMVIVVE